MALGIGVDIGSISIKIAVLGDGDDSRVVRKLAELEEFFPHPSRNGRSGFTVALSRYRRNKGRPLAAFAELLSIIRETTSNNVLPVIVTGSGGKLAASRYGTPILNEFAAITETVNEFHPAIRTVFEMGGETSKYILLGKKQEGEPLGILDYGTNGDCAAGTGAFMDQQASRLKYDIADVGAVVGRAAKAAQIAGRCSVFAKSDMIHAQQRGYQPDEVLKGLCNAVTRNFKSAITRSRKIIPPVLFIGGVSMNAGMLQAMREVFGLDGGEIIVPDAMNWFPAIGAAIRAHRDTSATTAFDGAFESQKVAAQFPSTDKLILDRVTLLREQTKTREFPKGKDRIPAYLGVDVGSVSTNLVAIDEHGNVLKEIYTRTRARPIEVVGEGLKEIERDIGKRIDIKGVGTTGSGRELIGILIGADTINDEITAHKTGALHISRSMLNREVDTIFEIGGQDSKYISIEDGIVVDFTMNDACAAGTGSFLEEQAEELEVGIVGEFSDLALSSDNPSRLGERCTVFMGKDVNNYLQRGADKKDIIAGLAYSVVHNYLNRVVGDRRIGDTIFFQGGTAYNDAVAAAFAKVTGKEIIVPPHNGVLGAIGEALLAKRKMDATGNRTTFKGFDLSKINYSLREFTCKHCTNFCNIQEFTVDGEKTYWGDKCSERYRKRKKIQKTPVIPDLFKFREKLLKKTYGENGKPGPVVGIPFTMYTYDRLPFFNTYLTECGFCTYLSEPTTVAIANKGIESVVAEPCYPITVAHGHIKALLDKNVDFIWLPNIINSETETPEMESYVCVWGSTLPFVAEHCPAFHTYSDRLLKPTLHFRDGEKVVKRQLFDTFGKLGVSRKVSNAAVDKAYRAQSAFRRALVSEGEKVFRAVRDTNEKAIVLVGRPYNIYDRAINLSVASKLSSTYGINVIPMDFLDATDTDIDHVNNNMYWNYGRRILQTAVSLAADDRFDIIYITNFKCGPDSFIKQFVRAAIGRPFLLIQFDGHSNDAGIMTRCEAYLDSKGFLRS